MSRWDSRCADRVPDDLKNELGLAVGLDVYRAYRELIDSDRCCGSRTRARRCSGCCGRAPSTKDPNASDTLYVHGLAAPFTVNTMPDETLESFYDHGEVGDPLPPDGGDADALFAQFDEGRGRPHGARREAAERRRVVVRRRVEGPDAGDRRRSSAVGERDGNSDLRATTGLEGARAAPRRDRRHAISATCSPADAGRGERLTAEAVGLYLDYSKNRVTDETMRLLLQLAEESGLEQHTREDVPRRAHQRLRGPVGAARRAADAEGHVARGRRRRRRRRGARGARPHEPRSPTGCGRASGRATPASPSATS